FPLAGVSVTPEPLTTISRHPSLSGNERSAYSIVLFEVSGTARPAEYSQTDRIVDRPPTPGGNVSPARVTVSARAEPSTDSASDGASAAHAGPRPASASTSETSPSP